MKIKFINMMSYISCMSRLLRNALAHLKRAEKLVREEIMKRNRPIKKAKPVLPIRRAPKPVRPIRRITLPFWPKRPLLPIRRAVRRPRRIIKRKLNIPLF